jgi:site-specific DNA-cytosine methylase
MSVTVRSVFSGAGGLDLGVLTALGPTATLLSWCEIEPAAQSVLRHHWPTAEEYHDVNDHPFTDRCDWWIGGPPCQDLSPAGARRGVTGERSGLIHAWADLVRRIRPRHVLVEEVPEGLDRDPDGLSWADACLGTLADMGYGLGWGVLDPRSVGVPQRRPRLFVLAALPTPREPAAAIARRAFECLADVACGRGVPPTLGRSWPHGEPDAAGGADPNGRIYDALTTAAASGTLCGGSPGVGIRTDNVEEPLIYVRTHRATSPTDAEIWSPADTSPTLNTFDDTGPTRAMTLVGPCLRRLTVIERERLMGWPDDWTRYGRTPTGATIETARTARHRLTGNGVVAPLAEAIVATWLRSEAS